MKYLPKGDLFRLGLLMLDEVVVWPVEIPESPTCGPKDLKKCKG